MALQEKEKEKRSFQQKAKVVDRKKKKIEKEKIGYEEPRAVAERQRGGWQEEPKAVSSGRDG
jgi:hypothetical protein